MTIKKEASDDAEERPLSERIVSMIVANDVPPQRIVDEIKSLEIHNRRRGEELIAQTARAIRAESENKTLKKRLAEDKAFLAEVESFLRWWHDLRAGSSITFDTEAFRVKLAKWLASQEESK